MKDCVARKYKNKCKEGTNMMNCHESRRILYLVMTTLEHREQRVAAACNSFSLNSCIKKEEIFHWETL